jgi:hypothetical protein
MKKMIETKNNDELKGKYSNEATIDGKKKMKVITCPLTKHH